MTTLPDLEPLEALARAYDREDASQRGEPDPWKDAEDDAEWVSERLACAQVAEAAYLAAARSAPEAGKAVAWGLLQLGNVIEATTDPMRREAWVRGGNKFVDLVPASSALASVAQSGAEPAIPCHHCGASVISTLSPQAVPAEDVAALGRKYEVTLQCYEGAISRYETAEAEATSLRRKLEEAELANKRLSDELDNLEQDACGSDDDFRRMTERAEAAEKALYLVTNERDNLSDNIAEITSREDTDLQAMKARAEAAERKLEEHRKALEPFAAAKGYFDGYVRDEDTIGPALRHIRAHHVRAAVRVLSGASE